MTSSTSAPTRKTRNKTRSTHATPPEAARKVGGIGDEAVKKATGRTWSQWLAIIDRAGGRTKDHNQIVAILKDQHGIGPWWRQMVTVGYEQARGRRDKHEKPGGFEVSASRTIDAPLSVAFRAFEDPRMRGRWLTPPDAGDLVIRKATPGKSMRLTWIDGATHLSVNFQDKGSAGSAKCQVVVQHTKLKNARDAARQKAYWQDQLGRLKALLEKA